VSGSRSSRYLVCLCSPSSRKRRRSPGLRLPCHLGWQAWSRQCDAF
jgi:hypothetical protein